MHVTFKLHVFLSFLHTATMYVSYKLLLSFSYKATMSVTFKHFKDLKSSSKPIYIQYITFLGYFDHAKLPYLLSNNHGKNVIASEQIIKKIQLLNIACSLKSD